MDWLKDLGLNNKEISLYSYLLESGSATASDLARGLSEQRTNVYLLLDRLIKAGLAKKDKSRHVAKFQVTNPARLQSLMISRQKALSNSSGELKRALPGLIGLYHLNSSEDGIAYFEGLKGYAAALDDMVKSGQEVCVFASSNVSRARPDAWDVLQQKLQKRSLAKVGSRMILSKEQALEAKIHDREFKLIDFKFWGDTPFQGEIAIYGNTLVLTTYDDKLISLVIKNPAMASTFQTIFDTVWAKPDN